MKRKQNPKISYEPEADVLRVEMSRKPIDYATEVGNVVVHFSRENVPVYLEFLEASKFLSNISNIVRNGRKLLSF